MTGVMAALQWIKLGMSLTDEERRPASFQEIWRQKIPELRFSNITRSSGDVK